MSENIVTLTDQDFTTRIQGAELPVIVDFWASWCGPCRMMAPVIEELAQDYAGRMLVGKVNVDENRQTAASFGITSIPTLVLFKDGKEVTRFMGFRPKEEILRVFSEHLA